MGTRNVHRALSVGLLLLIPASCVPDLSKNAVNAGPIEGDFAVSDYFSASGYMGDGENRGFLTVTRDAECAPRPQGAQGSCFHWTYEVGAEGWSGVYFQYPANNWGTQEGRSVGDIYQSVRLTASAEYRIVRPAGASIGASCTADPECRPGLGCTGGSCQPNGTRLKGQGCLISAECETDMQCSAQKCVAAGTAIEGESCARGDDADCAAGLRCSDTAGGGFVCTPDGPGDIDAACNTRADCRAGLLCGGEGTCYPRTEAGPYLFGMGAIRGFEHEDETGVNYNGITGPSPVLTPDPFTFRINLSRAGEFDSLIGGFVWAAAFPDVDEIRECLESEKIEGKCPEKVAYLADLSQPIHIYFDDIVYERMNPNAGGSGGAPAAGSGGASSGGAPTDGSDPGTGGLGLGTGGDVGIGGTVGTGGDAGTGGGAL